MHRIQKNNPGLRHRSSGPIGTGILARWCLALLVGIISLGIPREINAEDSFEPNNSFGQGFGLPEFAFNDAEAFDEDWFFFWSPGGGNDTIVIELFNTHSEGDLDIALYDPNGNFVASSTSITDNETIVTNAALQGYYYYRVYLGTNGQSYQHRWQVSDDGFEPNDSSGSGVFIPENRLLSTVTVPNSGNSLYSSRLNLFDEDWFFIDVPSGQLNLSIYCLFSHAAGDIELELYTAGGSILTSRTSSSDNEFLQFTVPSPGTYQIRTRFAGTGNGNLYDLYWSAKGSDDAYEANDLREFAYAPFAEDTPLSTLLGLGVSNEDDWYQITVSANEPNLTITLNDTSSVGDTDLQLVDSNGDVVASSETVSLTETIEYIAAPGTYFIRAFPWSGTSVFGSNYNLVWSADAGPTTTISPPSNSLPAVGGSYGITVTSNTNWSVTNLPVWASANPTSGTNNGVVNITVQSNATVNPRMQAIDIGGNTHTINQAAAGATTTINTPNHNSPSGGDSYQITVTSNSSWQVTGLPFWASANPSSGTGNGTVTVTVSPNGAITPRNQAISISGNNHLISQAAAAPTTSISPPTKNIAQTGEVYSIIITSNAPWTVSGIPSWMQVVPASGSGNGQVTVTARTNLGTVTREAVLTINGNQHSVVQARNPKDLAAIARFTRLVKKQAKKVKKAAKKGKKDKAKKLKAKLNKLKKQLRALQRA